MKSFIIAFLSIFLLSCHPPNDKQFSTEALNAPITTYEGDQITFNHLLETYKGKTLVIDIWASWCGDCIKGLPKLKKLQKKYPNATYIFISLDKNETAWKNGIKRFSIKGKHYYVKGGWKSIFAKNVDLDWIPRYIVVNPNSEVVVYRAIKANDSKIIKILKN